MATIKDLIGLGPDDLEKMSDEELRLVCEPCLRIAVVKQEEISTEDGQQEIQLEDTIAEQAKKKQINNRKKATLAEEIRKLAALHGVDAGIPTRIK